MSSFKDKVENAKDKVSGEIKEGVGKVFHNEELELKGKVQSEKATIKEKAADATDDIKDKAHDAKENVAGKVNDKIDEMNHKK